LTLDGLSKNHVMKELHPIFHSPDTVGDVDVGNLLVDWMPSDGDNDSKCAGSACDDNDDDAHGSDMFTPALPSTLSPPLPPTLRLLHAPKSSTQPAAGAVGSCNYLPCVGCDRLESGATFERKQGWKLKKYLVAPDNFAKNKMSVLWHLRECKACTSFRILHRSKSKRRVWMEHEERD